MFRWIDLLLEVLCSIHLISAFLLVSPIYFPPQIHIPSYVLHAGCNNLSFKWTRVLIFLVNHFILISNLWLVKRLNFLINCLDAISFFTQKGISIKITGFGISKKFCGIQHSSSFLFSFSINVLITLLKKSMRIVSC